jgi:hypothetical protein
MPTSRKQGGGKQKGKTSPAKSDEKVHEEHPENEV